MKFSKKTKKNYFFPSRPKTNLICRNLMVYTISTVLFFKLPLSSEILSESIQNPTTNNLITSQIEDIVTAYRENFSDAIKKPSISAVSAILINADTKTVIYEKNPYEQRAMASTTKIMSALLTLEAGNLDTEFVVDGYAIKVSGTSMGLLEGDIVTRRDLCYGMLLPSGNDASNAAAVSVGGSINKFVEMMNERAKSIGMKNTSFANPSGLDASGHYSNAYDMALLAAEALKNPTFKKICSTRSVQLRYGNPPYRRWLNNNNKLLNSYDGCIGVKTGFTDDARRCLVSAVERDGTTLIAVTLNAPNDWQDHTKMFDYGFLRSDRKIIDYDLSSYRVDIVGGVKKSVNLAFPEKPFLNLTDEEMAMVNIKINTVPFLYGGFSKGEFAGNITFYYNNIPLKSSPIVTGEDCGIKKDDLNLFDKVQIFLIRIFI